MTGFSCGDQLYPGYYADVQSNCQVSLYPNSKVCLYGDKHLIVSIQAFYICQADGRQDAFLCPNATIFNQQYFVCDWYYNVDCGQSKNFYSLNGDLYRENLANSVSHGAYGLGNGFGSSYGGDTNYKLGGYGVIPVSYSSSNSGNSNSDQTSDENNGQTNGGSTYVEGSSNGGVNFDSDDENSNGQGEAYGSTKNQGQAMYVNNLSSVSSTINSANGQKSKKKAGRNLRIQVGDRWSSDSSNVPRYSSKRGSGIKSRSSGIKGRTIDGHDKTV